METKREARNVVQHEKRIVWRKTVGEKDRNLADLLRGGANDEKLLIFETENSRLKLHQK